MTCSRSQLIFSNALQRSVVGYSHDEDTGASLTDRDDLGAISCYRMKLPQSQFCATSNERDRRVMAKLSRIKLEQWDVEDESGRRARLNSRTPIVLDSTFEGSFEIEQNASLSIDGQTANRLDESTFKTIHDEKIWTLVK
jgi:hypothetical protein